jgi:predicted nucleotidyltransferase
MKPKEEIIRTLKKELFHLREKFSVKTIGLFGSYARSEQTEESDIDLLVEFDKPVGFFKFIELEDHLSEKLGAKVDLVTPDALKPIIKPYVMEEVVYA